MRRILVVDDESGVREFVAEALEADGYETHALPSGEAALEELGKRQYALPPQRSPASRLLAPSYAASRASSPSREAPA